MRCETLDTIKVLIPNQKPLREHQELIIKQLNKLDSLPKITVSLLTGAGKTVLFFSYMHQPHTINKRALFIVPQINLAQQTSKNREVGYIQGKTVRGVNKRIVVANIHKLMLLLKANQIELNRFDYIFIDEAHKQEPRIKKLIERTNKKVRFLTATPFDGNGYYKPYLMDRIIGEEFNFKYMISKGYLVPYRFYQVGDLDTSGISRNKDGEYNDKELYERIKNSNIDIVQTSLKKIDKRFPTLITAQNIAHAEELHKEFNKAGFKCGIIHSKVEEDKEWLLKALEDRYYDALISVKMLITGVDIPSIGNIVLATRFGSVAELWQQLGRGARVAPNKTHCNVIDLFGNIKEHGHPYDFKPQIPKKKEKRAKKFNCPECGSGNLKTYHTEETQEEIHRFKKCSVCEFEDVEIIAKDTIKCNKCSFIGADYKLQKKGIYLWAVCPECNNNIEVVDTVLPKKLIQYSSLEHVMFDIKTINNRVGSLLNNSLLEEFLRVADAEHVAFIYDVLSNYERYTPNSIKKIENRMKSYISSFSKQDKKILEELNGDKEAFRLAQECIKITGYSRVFARIRQIKSRKLKSKMTTNLKKYLTYLKNISQAS
jgi:superfamily II DNA or RNA helicase